MAAVSLESNKTKIAKRVIEVLEFFTSNRPARVMDIARRYGRPQSSTSELLSSLVDMGLLYKDSVSRTYTPTPRVAALGLSCQPEVIRDRRLFGYMDELAQTSRRTIALFGLVGTHVQAFRWVSASRPLGRDVGCGSSEVISRSAAGLLLLTTLPAEKARGLLWRLSAEAPAEARFDHAQMFERVCRFRRQGYATGEAGFVPGARMTAILLPYAAQERPLALGVLYAAEAAGEAEALAESLKQGIKQLLGCKAQVR
jgi:DNA-binding IclR family transcriptional regulator